VLLKPKNIELAAISVAANTINTHNSKLEQLLQEAYEGDPWVANILEGMSTG